MYAPIYQLCTLLLSIVFLCALPAYLLGRRGIKQTLLTVEEGFSTRTCLIAYTLLGWGSIILLLLFAFFASSLIFFLIAGWNEPSTMQYVHSGTSVCSTILFAWIHIHTRRSRQRLRQKYPLTHRLNSLLSGTINSVGLICLMSGLYEPAAALLGVLIFALRYMLSYIGHRK